MSELPRKKVEQTAPNWEIFRIGELANLILEMRKIIKIQEKNCKESGEKIDYNSLELLRIKLKIEEMFISDFSNFENRNEELAILHSQEYERNFEKLGEKKVEIGKVSLFLKNINFEICKDNKTEKIERSLDLEFHCFWNGIWNIIYLEIKKDKVYLHRFLYDNDTAWRYKGLAHYFMSFVKILAIKLNLPIVLQSTSQATPFYRAEGFDKSGEKMVWINEVEYS